MTMLERVARALCVADGLEPDRKGKSSMAPEFAWQEYLNAAREALRALREPDEAMMQPFAHLETWQTPDIRQRWTMMVDAALVDPTPDGLGVE